MKTIEIQLFKFEELSEEAKQKAIERYQKSAYEDSDLLHFFSDDCEEAAKEAGFFDTEFIYSLNSCQGDGLSFSAGSVDIDRFIKEALPSIKVSVLNAVKNSIYKINVSYNNGHYCYASRSDVSIETDFPCTGRKYPNLQNLIDTIEAHIQDAYLSLCKELEKQGYGEIEYQTSEDCAREHLIRNEYDFTIDGKIY